MKVQNNDIIDYLLQSGSSKANDKKNSFDEILSLTLDKITSEAKVSDKLEQFKKRLTEIGAAGFMNELNSNKIEEKIAQKKEELTELNMALMSQTLLEKQNSLGKNTNNSVNLSSVLNELGLA